MYEKALCVGVLTTAVDKDDPAVNYIRTSLKSVHFIVGKTKVLSKDITVLTTQIEKTILHNHTSLLIGNYTNKLAKSLSNIFYQDLIDVSFGQVPRYSRFLGDSDDRVLYIQGLIVIPITCDVCRTFENVIKPFLANTIAKSCRNTMINGESEVVNSNSDIDDVYTFSHYEHVRKALENIEKCFAEYRPDNVFLSFNGGKDCTVLLHMALAVLKRIYPEYSNKLLCLYVESVDTFKEIGDFVEACETYYKIDIVKVTKNTREALLHILHDKPHLKACLMGTRRTDPFSEHLEIFQMTDPDWAQVMRVSPLLDWHYSQIWDYLLTLNVPYCKLYDMGYTSLGNVSNTIKNPLLCCKKDSEETYLPAYKLLDASQERQGRRTQLHNINS